MKLHLKDFVRKGESCHFARPHITPWKLAPHDHDFPEVFWVEAGRGWHLINGLERELRPGHLVLVHPTDCHVITAYRDQSIRIANVAFSRKTWEYIQKRYFPAEPDPFGLTVPEREFYLSGSSGFSIESLAGHFVSSARSLAQIEGFLLELGSMIFPVNNNCDGDRMPGWLARACHKICNPEYFLGGTQCFAALAGRSPDHVARETKRWLKKTPTEIVNEARMEYASVRLVSSEDKILDIAMECGLENLAHFYVLFQNQFQTTPRRYRLRGRRIVNGSPAAQ